MLMALASGIQLLCCISRRRCTLAVEPQGPKNSLGVLKNVTSEAAAEVGRENAVLFPLLDVKKSRGTDCGLHWISRQLRSMRA